MLATIFFCCFCQTQQNLQDSLSEKDLYALKLTKKGNNGKAIAKTIVIGRDLLLLFSVYVQHQQDFI